MGECFFWHRPTRVVPDKRPLNGCVCVCVTVCDVIWSVDIQGVYVARPVEQQPQHILQASTGQATEQAMGSRMAYCLHL